MSDTPSDPDLAAIAELPDTGRFAIDHAGDPMLVRTHAAVKALGNIAARDHSLRKEFRAWALTSLLVILGGISGLIWKASEMVAETANNGRRIEALEDAISREGRAWHRVDTATRASEE